MGIALVLILCPAFVFYTLLFRTAVNLPILDDYEIVLKLTNALSKTHGLGSKLALVLHNEHNGYKLIFENFTVWAMYSLLGHIRILPLVFLGDAFSLLTFAVVALMIRRSATEPAQWLLMVTPAAYLVFQLQYASALNFASSSLQHLAVIAFSFLAIYLLSQETRASFAGGCAASLLAIASSPNGFFLAPVGLLIFVQKGCWRRLATWIGLLIAALCLYLFRYNRGGESSLGQALRHINPTYILAFLGASAARYTEVLPGVLLGMVLCGIFALAVWRRYFLRNPAVFYAMLFILINAFAVSCLRSDSGIAQCLASRYRMYSNLMLVFSYFFVVETLVPPSRSPRGNRIAIASMLGFAMLFCLVSDVAGTRFLRDKKIALIAAYAQQRGIQASSNQAIEADAALNPALKRQLVDKIYDANLPILQESIRLGTYQPPALP